MKNIVSVFALGLAAALACGGLGEAQTQPQTQTPVQTKEARDQFVRAYRIGPEDILEINVFEVEEMNRTVRVEEDGTITLIGATTENPSFEVIGPLLSRCKV